MMTAVVPAPLARRWSAYIFLLGLLAGLALVFVVFDAQSFVSDRFDPYRFGEIGRTIASGEGFEQRYGTLMNRRSPLYPFVIAAIYFVFGEQPRLVQLLQCLLLAGTCWLVFDMGRRAFNQRTGIVAGVLCALHPLTLRYVADLHLETLLTFLFTLTVWCSVRFYEKPSLGRGVMFGLAAGFAALTKTVVVLYPAFFAMLWLAERMKQSRRFPAPASLVPLLATFIAMGLVILPWTIRNYRASGHFVLVTTGFGDAFLRGYIFSGKDYALMRRPPYTDAENASNSSFKALSRAAGTEWERDDWETNQILGREAKRKLLAEPTQFVRKFLVGLFTFWYQMTSLTNSLVTGVLALGAWVLALIGARRSWVEGRPVWLFLLPAVHLNLLLAALLALGRYSAPVIPALLVASAFGVDTLLTRLKRVRA